MIFVTERQLQFAIRSPLHQDLNVAPDIVALVPSAKFSSSTILDSRERAIPRRAEFYRSRPIGRAFLYTNVLMIRIFYSPLTITCYTEIEFPVILARSFLSQSAGGLPGQIN